MKKFMLFLLLPLLMAGCAKETAGSTDDGKLPEPEYAGRYAIPVEHAVAELQSVLDVLESDTRSGVPKRVIKGVETVVNGASATRSGDDGVSPVAYILEFETDGYAVVGADQRAPGVMAIVDAGKLKPIHFAYKELKPAVPSIVDYDSADYDDYSGIGGIEEELAEESADEEFAFVDEEDFPYLLGSFMNAYIQERIAEAEENPETRAAATWTWNGKTWTILEHVYIQCRSLWHQDSPFNDNVTAMKGKTVKAGCASIAMAQICTYHQYPKTWAGNALPWDRIRRVYTRYNSNNTSTGSDYDQEWTSYLVAVCGTQAKTDYGSSSSSAKIKNVAKAMKNLGYGGVSIRKGGSMDDRVESSIRSGCPVYYRGERSTGFLSWSGHAWVCDGLYRLQSGSEYMRLFHTNFGWGGDQNGWYRAGMFNSSRNMVMYSDYAGDSYNPDGGNAGRNYKTRQKAITYNRPAVY